MTKVQAYSCDECKLKKMDIGELPDGWLYIDNLEFRIKINKKHKLKDKHLCGEKCIMKFFKKIIEEAKRS